MSERLLLNLLLTMAPVFGYQLLMIHGGYQRNSTKIQLFMGLLSGISVMLCMTFPISSGENFVWDLRWVPFLISLVYGGVRGGLICSSMMVVYRPLLGTGWLAWAVVVVDVIILFPVALQVGKLMNTGRFVRRILYATFLCTLSYVIVELSIMLYFQSLHKVHFFLGQGPLFFIGVGVVTVLGCLLCIVLIESIFRQAAIQKQYERAERTNLVGDLAASFAHEIRNPLTVAKGFVQLLGETATETNKPFSDLAISELDRAEAIVTDYLNLAKPPIKHIETLDLDDSLRNVVQMMHPYAAGYNADIICASDLGLCIQADGQQFKQIMINIMKNAIESLPHGGTVTITTIRVQNDIHISVRDNGVGMTAEQLARLGRPFYTTKSKGTGLGMMITYRLIEEMGGKLHFESTIGTGTQALVEFPVVKRADVASVLAAHVPQGL